MLIVLPLLTYLLVTGRKSDPFTTYNAGPMAETCIMLANMDFIVDISSAYLIW